MFAKNDFLHHFVVRKNNGSHSFSPRRATSALDAAYCGVLCAEVYFLLLILCVLAFQLPREKKKTRKAATSTRLSALEACEISQCFRTSEQAKINPWS